MQLQLSSEHVSLKLWQQNYRRIANLHHKFKRVLDAEKALLSNKVLFSRRQLAPAPVKKQQ